MEKLIASLNIVNNMFIGFGIFILLISVALLKTQLKRKNYYSASTVLSWLGIAISCMWLFNLVQFKLHPSIAINTMVNKPIILSIAAFILCGLTCMVVTSIISRLIINHNLQKLEN